MPACSESSEYASDMALYSHGAKFSSTMEFRIAPNDRRSGHLYDANMPRKPAKTSDGKPEPPNWYLRAWMKELKVSQARLAAECDWSPSTMHGIYHGRTSYYRDIVNLIAEKLGIEPFELLMPPGRARAFRRFQESAADVVNFGERRTATAIGKDDEAKTGTYD